MPSVRATTVEVLRRVRSELADEAQDAAGNALLSRAEQAALGDGVLARGAEEVRRAGGPGARVAVDRLVDAASADVATLLGQVNQPAEPGASVVSKKEVRALAAVDSDAGTRVARAYELITGRHIELGNGNGRAGSAAPDDVLGGLGLTRAPSPAGVREALAQLEGPHWAAAWEGKPSDLTAVLADPGAHAEFFNDAIFHGTGTTLQRDFPHYYTPQGLTVTPVSDATAIHDLAQASRDMDVDPSVADSTARALVGALDAPGKKLFSLTWSNQDDTWFFGILAIDAANGTVQGVGWAPDA